MTRESRPTGDDTQRVLTAPAGITDHLRALALYPLPQHAISRLVYALTRCQRGWVKRPLTRWFIRRFRVPMHQAAEPDPDAYRHFNAFFTRALASGTRPLPASSDAVTAPADGAISALGTLHGDNLIQAKGRHYGLTDLLGGAPEDAAPLHGGHFATIYLSPADYHRVHMPVAGDLRAMIHIPGRLFSVGRPTVRTVPKLFTRNERVACLFDTAVGPMALVLVGAINVGSIETVWAGEVTPPRGRRIQRTSYEAGSIRLDRGEEMGRFNMGSTAIVVLPPGTTAWDTALEADTPVRVNQPLGTLIDG